MKNMNKLLSAFGFAIATLPVMAQSDDPIVMTINGEDVTRSEFEYSYNKNNTDLVVDKASLDEYVELFVNYKLKVAAAKEAQLDTMASFQKEVADYRAQQAEEYLIDKDFIEAEARKTYEATARNIGPDGMFKAAHILIHLNQHATPAEQAAAKVRIDSIYMALQNGADFGELAKRLSQDPGSAQEGGMLPWLSKGQLLKEFEDVALAMKPGEPLIRMPEKEYKIIKLINQSLLLNSNLSMENWVWALLILLKIQKNYQKKQKI